MANFRQSYLRRMGVPDTPTNPNTSPTSPTPPHAAHTAVQQPLSTAPEVPLLSMPVLLSADCIDLAALSALVSRSCGTSQPFRPLVWRLLCGALPPHRKAWPQVELHQAQAYADLVAVAHLIPTPADPTLAALDALPPLAARETEDPVVRQRAVALLRLVYLKRHLALGVVGEGEKTGVGGEGPGESLPLLPDEAVEEEEGEAGEEEEGGGGLLSLVLPMDDRVDEPGGLVSPPGSPTSPTSPQQQQQQQQQQQHPMEGRGAWRGLGEVTGNNGPPLSSLYHQISASRSREAKAAAAVDAAATPPSQSALRFELAAAYLVAGVLEEDAEAFEVLCGMMESIIRSSTHTYVITLRECVWSLRDALETELPSLAAHFRDLSVSLEDIVSIWFRSLFLDSLAFDHVERVVDLLLTHGLVFFAQIAQGVLQAYAPRLLGFRRGEGVMAFLSELPDDLDISAILRTARPGETRRQARSARPTSPVSPAARPDDPDDPDERSGLAEV